MSFNNLARQVRDPGLPHGLRVSYLRSCVQLYRPIGYFATLSLLEARAGRYGRDEGALLAALDVLEASRAAWHAELREFDTARRAAKARGRRRPGRAERNPYLERWWSGAPREGALHAVAYLHGRRWARMTGGTGDDPVAADLERCVTACLAAGGELAADQRLLLADCVRRLRERRTRAHWLHDAVEWSRTGDLLWLAHHVEVAAGG
ncbi:hypothetical protein [Streptomyces sp. NPDC049040]|uniref:hypothetical protein n=1 Tax=Streptomyces sp. NPDC049040 TaxID=3365593 RepID=UPI00371ED959